MPARSTRLVLCAVMAAAALRVDAAEPAALEPGQWTGREIARGESHRFSVRIAPETCLPLQLRQTDIDVWLKAYHPSGELVLDLNWEEWGEERYQICSAEGGRFGVEVRASDQDTHRGVYRLTVGQSRSRSPKEPDWMEVQRSVAAAIRARTESEPLERALAVYRQHGDRWAEMKTESHLARAYHRKEVFAPTIQHQRAALALARRLQDRTEEAISLRELYRAYGHVGETLRRATARQGYIRLMVASADKRLNVAALEAKATAAAERGDLKAAIAASRAAARYYEASGKRDAWQELLSKIAGFYIKLNEFEKAREAAEAFLAAQKATGLARHEASGYATLGSVAFASGKYVECESYFQTAAAIHRMTGETLGESACHAFMSYSAQARGDYPEALRRINWAIRGREKARQSVPSLKWQAGMEDSEHRRTRAEILMAMHRQDPSAGHAEQALLAADSMRAGYIARGEPGLGDMRSLLTGGEVLVEYLLAESGSALWVLDGRRLQVYDLPGSKELAPLAESYRSALIARNRRSASESAAERALRIQQADQRLEVLGAQLSRRLLSPLAGIVGERKLLIVPDGPLEHLPYAALRDPADPAGRPMGHVREVAYLPSAGSVLALRQRRLSENPKGSGIAVVADPVFRADDPRLSGRQTPLPLPEGLAEATRALGLKTIPRLLYSRVEGQSIAKYAPEPALLFDFDATREAFVKGSLGEYRLLHFAAHGISNPGDPSLSGLVLSLVDRAGRPQNGFLRFEDVYGQRLKAEMVVLSACQTAIGKRFDETGMMTMAGAFLHAGAARVVSTLWKIDDEATSEFMKVFYREALGHGAPPTAALKTAQQVIARSPRWRSPYYWGAFILQGWPD